MATETEHMLITLFIPQTKGECIARFRNLLALTQTEISSDLGLNRTSISKMENGDMAVSENVWRHIIYLVYNSLEINMNSSFTFSDFKNNLELWIEEKNENKGGSSKWKERKSSLVQEMNI